MSVILHTDVNYMHFVHFLLKLKQVHNLKNRVFSHTGGTEVSNIGCNFLI
jgi:hypothetical protein